MFDMDYIANWPAEISFCAGRRIGRTWYICGKPVVQMGLEGRNDRLLCPQGAISWTFSKSGQFESSKKKFLHDKKDCTAVCWFGLVFGALAPFAVAVDWEPHGPMANQFDRGRYYTQKSFQFDIKYFCYALSPELFSVRNITNGRLIVVLKRKKNFCSIWGNKFSVAEKNNQSASFDRHEFLLQFWKLQKKQTIRTVKFKTKISLGKEFWTLHFISTTLQVARKNDEMVPQLAKLFEVLLTKAPIPRQTRSPKFSNSSVFQSPTYGSLYTLKNDIFEKVCSHRRKIFQQKSCRQKNLFQEVKASGLKNFSGS